jgi:hypothetical protein
VSVCMFVCENVKTKAEQDLEDLIVQVCACVRACGIYSICMYICTQTHSNVCVCVCVCVPVCLYIYTYTT